MEKLIFRNATGQTIEFSKTSPFKWQGIDDLGGLESVQQVTTSPFQDGSTPTGESYFKSKVIRVNFVILGNEVDSWIRQLNSILNPKLGIGSLDIHFDGEVKTLRKVKTKKMPTLQGNDKRGNLYQLTSVIFEVFDPLFESEEQSSIVRTGDNLFEFPLNLTDTFRFDVIIAGGFIINNDGDVPSPVTIALDGVLTAPIEILNDTTGEKIIISLDLTADEQLVINTKLDELNVTKITTSTGEEVSAFQYIDVAESTFFYLRLGENTIKVSSLEGAVEKTEIKRKNRFVGL